MPISVIILAGGRGERLGQDKATVKLGGATLLERVVGILTPYSDDLIVAVRPDQELVVPGARVVSDLAPFSGVLAAMAAGLMVARHAWSFVVACDMPFVNPRVVRTMYSQRRGYDAVVPRVPAGLEPLHALYHRRCLASLKQALRDGRRRVISFYATIRVRYVESSESRDVDPREISFFNINTAEDLDQARKWLEDS